METWVSPLRAPVPPGALCYVRGKGRVAAPAEPDRRVVPLVGRGKARALVLCAESNLFRDLARTQVAPDDRVLEIGCSYGEATAILAAACPTVLGVDHSRTVLRTAAEKVPSARFEQVDVLAHPGRVEALARDLRPTVVFVDLGGNSPPERVVPLLARLHAAAPTWTLCVVKCRALARAAERHCAEGERRLRAPAASNFWAVHFARAEMVAHAPSTAGLGVSVEDDLNPKSTADAPICYSFLNAGRCYRKFCSFRHLVPEHPEARADAARRGMAIGPRVEAAVT